MEYIGQRISIKRDEDKVSIVILSTKEKRKSLLLSLWLFLWSVSGIIVFVEFFTLADQNTKTAIIVWLGFWAYFEYKIYKSYQWRRAGVEKIKLRNNTFIYKRDVAGKGKTFEYEYDFIKDLRMFEAKENSFMDSLNNSYWMIAGEKLAFDYNGRIIRFGIQLEDKEAKALLSVINQSINQQ